MAKATRRSSSLQSGRLSKEDWVTAALQQLGQSGVAGIQVERLARSLGVTKGSFYWHFKDRDALLVEMLRYWQYSSTSRVVELAKMQAADDPAQRLRFLLNVASEDRQGAPGGDVEHALREWARNSEIAQRTIAEVDNERIAAMTELYAEMGMTRPKASAAAVMAMAYFIGVNVIYRDIGLQAFRTQRQICVDYLMKLAQLDE